MIGFKCLNFYITYMKYQKSLQLKYFSQISKKPSSINHAEASSIPYAGLTAWTALTCFGGLSEKSAYGKRYNDACNICMYLTL